ncbi:extracellular ribonuclease LE-like [Castanea sativa]|uniref:extracellular ribonuclease LE-like n=1 Tax=Castanea sativa TaxID=21020 RepID=UPI003F65451A
MFFKPESYCNTGKVTCYDDAWEYRFTLHGMWPQKNGQGVSCPGSPDFHFDEVQRGSNDLLGRMDQWWPSFNAAHKRSNRPFWNTEWKKHGTCTPFTQSKYFEKAISGAEYLNLYRIRPGMQTYTSEIKNEIEMTFNLKPRIQCNEDQYGTVQLYEITFCVDKTGTQFQNCAYSAACNLSVNSTAMFL